MYNFRTDLASERRDIYKKANKLENEIDGIESTKEEKDEKSNFIYGRYFGEYDVERSVSLECYAGSRLGSE